MLTPVVHTAPIKLISTDFDGTLFAEFDPTPIPGVLVEILRRCQQAGILWVINTGRELSSLMEALGRCHAPLRPDYLVTVEREIHRLEESAYTPVAAWNQRCNRAHRTLFGQVKPRLPELAEWINARFPVTLYADPYSPLCLIAQSNEDADAIQSRLDEFCAEIPHLTAVRNDVYIRFSHDGFNKGTALEHIAGLTGCSAAETLAAGDHFNDLPMLDTRFARCLIAPANAIPQVKEQVLRAGGYVSSQPCGHGTARGLEHHLTAQRILP